MTDAYTQMLPFVVAAVVGGFFFVLWQKNAQRSEEARRHETLRAQEIQFKQAERNEAYMRDLLRTVMERPVSPANSADPEGLGLGGYIIFDVPDANKGLFHDLLKGFEEYARIRGYVIRFSIDNSFPNKVAFKFTLDENGVVVSTRQVREDLKEYIEKVQKGESLDDLPVVLPQEEHHLLLVAMKNRINFLQHTYTLQKNAIDFYDGLFKRLPAQGFGVSPAQNFYLQSGQSNQLSSYNASNSPQTAQGVGHRLIGNQLDQRIHIANSFNERQEQIEALSKLWSALYADREKIGDEALAHSAMKLVQKAEEELREEEQPDPTRVHRWLEHAKNTLKALALTKDVSNALHVVVTAFKILS